MLLRRFSVKGVDGLLVGAVGFLLLLEGTVAMNSQLCLDLTSLMGSTGNTLQERQCIYSQCYVGEDQIQCLVIRGGSSRCTIDCVQGDQSSCVFKLNTKIECSYKCCKTDNTTEKEICNALRECSTTTSPDSTTKSITTKRTVTVTEVCNALIRECSTTTSPATATSITTNRTGPTSLSSTTLSPEVSTTVVQSASTTDGTGSSSTVSGPPTASPTTASTSADPTTAVDESSPNSQTIGLDKGTTNSASVNRENDNRNLPIIVTVVVAGVIVLTVVLISIFLLRRKGVLCAGEPEQVHTIKSMEISTSKSKNRYSDIPTGSDVTNSPSPHNSGMSSSNGSTGPPGLPGKAGSDVESCSTGAKGPTVYLTLVPDSSHVVPSAPVYFTVEADYTSRLAGDASCDHSAAGNMAEGNADDVYHVIDERDVRPQEADDYDYSRLEEKKPTVPESGAIYGHLESTEADYDHVTKGKRDDVRVRHNDYDVAPAARVDSGDYHHLSRDIQSDVTVANSDYDVAQPRKQSVSKDVGDYDYPPKPKKVKDAKGNRASLALGKGATAGCYELAAPVSPGGPVVETVSMPVSGVSPGSESGGQLKEPDIPSSEPKTSGSPYEMASAVV